MNRENVARAIQGEVHGQMQYYMNRGLTPADARCAVLENVRTLASEKNMKVERYEWLLQVTAAACDEIVHGVKS